MSAAELVALLRERARRRAPRATPRTLPPPVQAHPVAQAVRGAAPLATTFRPQPTPRSVAGARNWLRNRVARVAYTYLQDDLVALDSAVNRLNELALVLAARLDELLEHQAQTAEELERGLDYLALHLPSPTGVAAADRPDPLAP